MGQENVSNSQTQPTCKPLTTPDDDDVINRGEMANFVLEWTDGGKYNFPYMNELGQKIMNIGGGTVWSYYMISMSKYYLEHKESILNYNELMLKSVEMMLDYIAKETNKPENSALNYSSVKENIFLKEMIDAKTKNKLKEYLNL